MKMSNYIAKNAIWCLGSVILIGLDQLIKFLCRENVFYEQQIIISKFINLTFIENRGVAFSFFNQGTILEKSLFIVIPIIFSLYMIKNILNSTNYLLTCAYMLLLAGAIGNLLDRIIFGYVIDYIQLHYNAYYFPTFNLADAFITIGTCIWMFAISRKNISNSN